jgi:hypothetical protein
MFETRVLAGRVTLLSWLVIGLMAAGCAPGMHAVRLRTVDGQVRTTTPRPRPPLALPKEEVHQAVRALAHKVVPRADPLELARQRFDVPVRGGVFVFSPRTKQLRPLDAAAAEIEAVPPELAKQARDYLGWCQNIHKHGDCLQILRNGGILDAHGRYAVAMAIAQGETIEATKASLKGMVNPDAVMAMLVSGMTMYMMLWVLPEPVSKGIAAVMTAVLVVYLGVDTLYTLGWGWKALVDAADKATTFDELRAAGEQFGKVMGADTARILLMLATAAMGSEAKLAEVAPTLPGAAQASRLAVEEGGIALEAVGAVESVTIAESGLTIALAPGAVAMSSNSDDFGRRRRIQIARPDGSEARSISERIRALKNAGVKGDLDKLESRIGKDPGAIGELEAIERWLSQGTKGEEIEMLERSTVKGQKTPDFRVNGELTEIKTRDAALSEDYIHDRLRDANAQMKESGLDAGRRMTGVDRSGPQGQLEIQLKGEAARTGTLEVIEVQVRKAFTADKYTSLRRVAFYGEGKLIGEWVRTASNTIVRTFPPP